MVNIIDDDLFRLMFLNAYNALESEKDMLNALNVFPVPDGDTGTNMSLTMKSAVKEITENENMNIKEIAESVSRGSLMGARGNSGVILSQLIRGISKIIEKSGNVNVRVLSEAFQNATQTAYRAVMKPTEGTILTVARGCSDAAKDVERRETDIVKFMKHIIDAGNKMLEKTPDMLPALKEAGVVDAGGKGYMVILEGMLAAITGDIKISTISEEPVIVFDKFQEMNPDDIKFGYCTEFIINDTNANVEKFKYDIENLGDSSLVIGDNNIIKVHIHTNDPGEVLKRAVVLGELVDIKIDNMRYQNSNIIAKELGENSSNPYNIEPEVDVLNLDEDGIGIISVSIGKGLENVFDELGVDIIISGGQTMNPSTEDILNAIEKMKAKNIIILPNNSNIILAANQAKDISDRNVQVIPTKSIQAGIASLIEYDSDISFEENVKVMTEASNNIRAGQVTHSIKDTSVNGINIEKDDIIGILDKDIICNGKDLEEVTEELVDNIVSSDIDILTIIYGEDVEKLSAEKFSDKIKNKYSDIDIELIYGGQPVYYYLISGE